MAVDKNKQYAFLGDFVDLLNSQASLIETLQAALATVTGYLRPYRLFSPVGSVPVSADDTTDPTKKGKLYKITKIQVQTISAPTLVSTITIKNGSTTIFTQNVALASVPAVGKALDLLTLANNMPANLALPATLTCTASAGTFEILLDGVLV